MKTNAVNVGKKNVPPRSSFPWRPSPTRENEMWKDKQLQDRYNEAGARSDNAQFRNLAAVY